MEQPSKQPEPDTHTDTDTQTVSAENETRSGTSFWQVAQSVGAAMLPPLLVPYQ